MASNGTGGTQDPWDRQYSMLRLGLVSSCVFVVVIILVALSRAHRVPLALGIAAAWLVLDSTFIYFFLRSVRRKHSNSSSGFAKPKPIQIGPGLPHFAGSGCSGGRSTPPGHWGAG
jgi:hypothetical protein